MYPALRACDVINVDEGVGQLGEFTLGRSFRLQFHLVDFQAAYWSIFQIQYVYWIQKIDLSGPDQMFDQSIKLSVVYLE